MKTWQDLERISLEVQAACRTSPLTDDVKESAINAVISVVQEACPTKLLSNENKEDFHHEVQLASTFAASTAASILNALSRHQGSLADGNEIQRQQLVRAVVTETAPSCLLLVAMQQEQHPWTNAESKAACAELGSVVCRMCGCDSIVEVLNEGRSWTRGMGNTGMFKEVMGLLRTRLTRDEWHKEPVTKQAFKWCLVQLKHPFLSNYFESVLPPSLLFVDDYKVNNKILGVRCLQHIIDNVDPTELRWHDRADVIYEALHPLLYNHSTSLVGHLLPCLVGILAVVERSPHKADVNRKPNRYDAVLQVVLSNMEFEQTLLLRQAYARYLHLFIDSMGITILRHMKTVLRVLLKYLEAGYGEDDMSKVFSLTSLRALIHQAWPRIDNHWASIIEVLLKLLIDVCDNTNNCETTATRQLLKDACIDCMILLKRCCETEVTESLKEILGITSEDKDAMIDQCIVKVLDS